MPSFYQKTVTYLPSLPVTYVTTLYTVFAPTATVWLRSQHWLLLRTDSPDTGEVARSARMGTLAPKVTEGWLGDDSCPWGHPSPACRRELPSRGAINPTPVEFIWPRRGQPVGRRKSVKKNAALLHFLAFSLPDHLSGVPRGRAPWAGVRCLGTARLFSLPFLVTKKEGLTGASH